VSGPNRHVVRDADELDLVSADLVGETINANPTARIVAATGRTPMGLYATLAGRRRDDTLDTSGITIYQLDEYLGLEPDDGRSLFGWMRRSVLEPLDVPEERVRRLPLEGDLDAGCTAFDAELDGRGPLDLAILGLGLNGHLGFNEPPSDAASGTRVVQLSPMTIQANSDYWGPDAGVPAAAVTMGMHHLLSARRIVLLVSGAGKHAIVRRALEGPVGPDVPASFLQQATGDVQVVVDRAAWGEG
jgi:glucosamine-6-phosphate deaminase